MSAPHGDGHGQGLIPGLVKGLATTARNLLTPAHTAEYPDVPPILPPRSRGVIALLAENCTSCMLCARECPDWCIYIDAHKETVPAATPGGRDRQRNVLDRFAIDFSLCMYCGICIEVCPFDALFWSPQFEYAELDLHDLLHEKERLGGPNLDRDPGGSPMTGLDIAFAATGSVTVAAALLAVTTRHLVHAALWLVVSLLGLAGCYLVLGAELVALIQVLVYVGAVVVLVLFALMLTRAPIGPSSAHTTSRLHRVLAAVLGAGVAGLLLAVLVPLAGERPVTITPTDSTDLAGDLFRTWVWPFELLSLLLVAALVAALAVSRMTAPSTDQEGRR